MSVGNEVVDPNERGGFASTGIRFESGGCSRLHARHARHRPRRVRVARVLGCRVVHQHCGTCINSTAQRTADAARQRKGDGVARHRGRSWRRRGKGNFFELMSSLHPRTVRGLARALGGRLDEVQLQARGSAEAQGGGGGGAFAPLYRNKAQLGVPRSRRRRVTAHQAEVVIAQALNRGLQSVGQNRRRCSFLRRHHHRSVARVFRVRR